MSMVPDFSKISPGTGRRRIRGSNNKNHEIIDAACCMSETWGQRNGSKSWWIRDDGADIEFSLANYVYKDDKVFIEANDGCSYERSAEGKKARIVLRDLNTVVFECEYYREPTTYRPGKWEEYVLSMGRKAHPILLHRNISRESNARRMRESRFDPVDDSDIF